MTESVTAQPETVSRMEEGKHVIVRNLPQAESKPPEVYVIITPKIKQENEPTRDPVPENVSTGDRWAQSRGHKNALPSASFQHGMAQGNSDAPAEAVYIVPDVTPRIKQENEPTREPIPGDRWAQSRDHKNALPSSNFQHGMAQGNSDAPAEAVYIVPDVSQRIKQENEPTREPMPGDRWAQSRGYKNALPSASFQHAMAQNNSDAPAEAVYVVPDVSPRIKQENEPTREPMPGDRWAQSRDHKNALPSASFQHGMAQGNSDAPAEAVYIVPDVSPRIKQENESTREPIPGDRWAQSSNHKNALPSASFQHGMAQGNSDAPAEAVYVVPDVSPRIKQENESTREPMPGDRWAQSRDHKNALPSASFQHGMAQGNSDAPAEAVYIVPDVTPRIKQENEPMREPMAGDRWAQSRNYNNALPSASFQHAMAQGNSDAPAEAVYIVPEVSPRIKQDNEPTREPIPGDRWAQRSNHKNVLPSASFQHGMAQGNSDAPAEAVYIVPDVTPRIKQENEPTREPMPGDRWAQNRNYKNALPSASFQHAMAQGNSDAPAEAVYIVPDVSPRIKQENESTREPIPGDRWAQNRNHKNVLPSASFQHGMTQGNSDAPAEAVYVVPDVTPRIKQENEPTREPMPGDRWAQSSSHKNALPSASFQHGMAQGNSDAPAEAVYVVPDVTPRIKQENQPMREPIPGDRWAQSRDHKNALPSSSFQHGMAQGNSDAPAEAVYIVPDVTPRIKQEKEPTREPMPGDRWAQSSNHKNALPSASFQHGMAQGNSNAPAEAVYIVPDVTPRIKQENAPTREPMAGDRWAQNRNHKNGLQSASFQHGMVQGNNGAPAEAVYIVPDATPRIKQENEPMREPIPGDRWAQYRNHKNALPSFQHVMARGNTGAPAEDVYIVPDVSPRIQQENAPTREPMPGDRWAQNRNPKNVLPSASFQHGMAQGNSDAPAEDVYIVPDVSPRNKQENKPTKERMPDWVVEDVVTPVQSSNAQAPSSERPVNVWFVKRVVVNPQSSDKGENRTESTNILEPREGNNSLQKRPDNHVADGYANSERKPATTFNSPVPQGNLSNLSGLQKQPAAPGQFTSVCSECGECFPDKTSLEEHLIHHMEENIRVCPVCAQCFTSQSDLETHLKTHRGGTSWPCYECGKTLFTRSSLDRHRMLHIRDRPLPCPECGKGFIKRSNYEMHLRLHAGEVFYPCTICEKLFNVKAACDRHIRAHTMERPHVCPDCGKRFLYNGCLIRHIRVHTGERPFPCPHCGKCFRENSSLKRHLRIHTEDKPYNCPESGEGFTNQYNPIQHQEVHKDDQPFVQYVQDDEETLPTYVIL
ncbi:uncharacterized protein LOC134949554 isoform X5 [Pseudophryne corroboree]|uniref:uncharacterized protein LOC134949554 isoform X5 n=1 Tax=Pseudophryne corroboree TaxID=495146 RepID=UPI0030821539